MVDERELRNDINRGAVYFMDEEIRVVQRPAKNRRDTVYAVNGKS